MLVLKNSYRVDFVFFILFPEIHPTVFDSFLYLLYHLHFLSFLLFARDVTILSLVFCKEQPHVYLLVFLLCLNYLVSLFFLEII